MATDRIKLGGLWVNKSKDGREYLTGKLSPTVKILIFKNDFKTTDNQPSHVMYLAPVETDETQRPNTQNTPAPSSFLGGSEGGRGDSTPGSDPADDDFFPEDDAAPLPAPTPASNARAPRPGPAASASTAGSGNSANRAASQGQSGQARPQNRPSQPAKNDDNLEDFGDPFDE